jgi:8-oxo-dGTP pyrophosphatase MutT (NUDIX family)
MNTPATATAHNETWAPRVTVAAIVERDGRFLLVEEHTPDGLRLNQPAGHLEPGETLSDAAIREALEETACAFVPQALVGVYMTHFAGLTYLRFAYCGVLDRTVWLSADELRAQPERQRTPLVLRCIEDYLAGRRYPLDAVVTHATGPRR